MLDERVARYVSLVPERDRYKSFHLIETDGSSHSRGAAVVASLTTLSRTRYLGRALSALHATRLIDVLYWAVAKNRERFGRVVRDAPGPVRFSG